MAQQEELSLLQVTVAWSYLVASMQAKQAMRVVAKTTLRPIGAKELAVPRQGEMTQTVTAGEVVAIGVKTRTTGLAVEVAATEAQGNRAHR
jgi:hypothetical protein